MFFICRLEVLVSLRYLDHKRWLFSIFEGTIGQIALLVERICSIVRGTVQLGCHINKINKTARNIKESI
jgi:hypothetical protein